MELGQEWYEWGLWGLFLATFLSATLIPMASELLLLFMLTQGYNAALLLIISTAGNWLGGMSTYALGWFIPLKHIPLWLGAKETKVNVWVGRIREKGALLALLCWMPFIGDVLALALGSAKASPLLSGLYMLLGKALRYSIIIAFWHFS